MKKQTGLILLVLLACGLCFTAPAKAQEAGERVFEIYVGEYVPGIDDLDNDLTGGIRFGGRPGEMWGYSFEAGYLDLTQNNTRPLSNIIGGADGYFVDGNVIWYIMGSDFGLFGGIGFASVDVDFLGTTTDASDDAFTYNYGIHYAWNFGGHYLVKPEIRWRKFDGDTYEKTDEEYSVSFGWRF